jgi:hypothetical protein
MGISAAGWRLNSIGKIEPRRILCSWPSNSKNANFADLHIAPSALYLLAAPSTPEAARLEALERAEAGEAITHSAARNIVAEHKAAEEKDDPLWWDREGAPADTGPTRTIDAQTGEVFESAAPINFSPAESVEWYTPARYIDAARRVMGGIDTDPASNDTAQGVIQAGTHYTIDDDGFNRPWRGRVWLNPPYGVESGKAVAGKWAERLIEQRRLNIASEAVLLVNAVIDSKWFNVLWQFPICFTDHRIRFEVPAGTPKETPNSPVIGSAIVYMGDNVAAFVREFSQFGAVVSRLHAQDEHVFTELEAAHAAEW